jgi:hypothetical protein
LTRDLGPLRKVVSVGDGKNPMLVLECGHGRRHSRGVAVPKRVHCMDCAE